MKKLTLVTSFVFCFSSALAFAGSNPDCSDEAHYPLISKSELKKVADAKDATIVDVNSKASYKKAHVPGAIHFESHEKDFVSMLPAQKDKLIVAYCGGVMCTAWKKAAEIACNQGYTNIKHFKEGISGWVKN